MSDVKIKINLPQIKQIDRNAKTALEQTAEALHDEIENAQIIPKDTGNLQDESTFVDYSEINQGKVKIVSSTPYARRLYYHPEYNFSTKENQNAQGKWFEPWISGEHKDFAEKVFKMFYRRLI